jgi:predicted aldo/keto reductase-like oxidoreductase
MVSHSAFSIDSLKDINTEEGVSILRKAYESGINFYHTSNEALKQKEMLGYAFYGMRKEVFFSISSSASDSISLQQQIIQTLDSLNSNYIDIFSIHNNNFVPKKGSIDGLYTALLSARADENIKHIGFSTSNLDLAKEALASDFYDVIVLEYDFSQQKLTKNDFEFIEAAQNHQKGIIINFNHFIYNHNNFSLIFGFLHKSENIIPMWNIENQEELQQILFFESKPPQVDEKFLEEIENLKEEN